LHLGLLQAEEISIEGCECVGKAFASAGTEAVYVPGNEFHINYWFEFNKGQEVGGKE